MYLPQINAQVAIDICSKDKVYQRFCLNWLGSIGCLISWWIPEFQRDLLTEMPRSETITFRKLISRGVNQTITPLHNKAAVSERECLLYGWDTRQHLHMKAPRRKDTHVMIAVMELNRGEPGLFPTSVTCAPDALAPVSLSISYLASLPWKYLHNSSVPELTTIQNPISSTQFTSFQLFLTEVTLSVSPLGPHTSFCSLWIATNQKKGKAQFDFLLTCLDRSFDDAFSVSSNQ